MIFISYAKQGNSGAATSSSTPTSAGTSGGTSQEVGADDTYEPVVAKYKLLWFDRSSGWEGTSYPEGLAFCSSLSVGYTLCVSY